MPELAEVEFFRKRWHQAASGQRVVRARLHPAARIFRGANPAAIVRALTGAKLVGSEAQAKQMLFRFSGQAWLGVHLGMSGELEVKPAGYVPEKHDHLVLDTKGHALVFTDPRMFGRVQFHEGKAAPPWWTRIAPPILSKDFTVAGVAAFLRRRARAPIKAVLLMQERFPGVGNWMADEILWRAALHPKRPAGSLTPAEVRTLWRESRRVCRLALDTIAGKGELLPADLNKNIPRTWLFRHRWRKGGRCPITGGALSHAEIGGRTTCWSPMRQKL
ncbi:MAG: DNA-formamidopyrimidine glycosylase [Verrucomicrobia bacterium]|nr:DNA-formamidopyrimidine glycosylase [Verrucomicrobiota bacterium]